VWQRTDSKEPEPSHFRTMIGQTATCYPWGVVVRFRKRGLSASHFTNNNEIGPHRQCHLLLFVPLSDTLSIKCHIPCQPNDKPHVSRRDEERIMPDMRAWPMASANLSHHGFESNR
jgi:hypothetical protein